jgi:hypothetical protein
MRFEQLLLKERYLSKAQIATLTLSLLQQQALATCRSYGEKQ